MTSPKRKLLILENDPAVAEALRREFAPLGFDVHVAVPAEDPHFVDSIDMLCVLGHETAEPRLGANPRIHHRGTPVPALHRVRSPR